VNNGALGIQMEGANIAFFTQGRHIPVRKRSEPIT
jgi:hypothetical protein